MHVLLATDGSEISLEATRHGLSLLADPAKVTLLTVTADLPIDTGGGIEGPVYTPEQEEELVRDEEEHAQHSLAETRSVLESIAPRAEIDQRIETGDPAATICLVARDLGVDAIVIGSHGKGFLARVVLGSVSEHVTRHAPCPVLVVRAEHAHDES
jgi:nucleotide-binding universal stress UspA family protein